jgi:hypothetical protein
MLAASRFIPLAQQGQTVDDLYRTGSQAGMEEALARWLRARIQRIKQERGLSREQGVA